METVEVYIKEDENRKRYIILGGDVSKVGDVDIDRFNKENLIEFKVMTPGYSWAFEPAFPKGPIGLHPAASKTKPPGNSDFWQWSLQIDEVAPTAFRMRYPRGPVQVKLDWYWIRVVEDATGSIIELDPKIRNGFPDAVASQSKLSLIAGAIVLALISFGLGFKFSGI